MSVCTFSISFLSCVICISSSHFSRLYELDSLMAASRLLRNCFASSRALLRSVRTLLHFSRQFAVQSDHHFIVFSICAARARASSSSRCRWDSRASHSVSTNLLPTSAFPPLGG
uniref:Putative secreted protein n=1 Tax=Anopheles darlingi TaxID=43151 RepID=A0A2M4D6G7_ANODA